MKNKYPTYGIELIILTIFCVMIRVIVGWYRMALVRGPNLKLIPDGKGGWKEETYEEYRKRREEERKHRYEEAISRIIERGFTREQAEYLKELEDSISEAAHTYTPPPRY